MTDEDALLGPEIPAHTVDEEASGQWIADAVEESFGPLDAPGGFNDVLALSTGRLHEIGTEPEPEHESEPQAALKAPMPEPLMRGRFAVYETPDKGYHLTYQLDGEETAQHLEFPGMLVALARKRGAAAGGLGGMAGFMKQLGGK